jgi:phosphoglycolate phosphatase-like HAD superfamily hydrolase
MHICLFDIDGTLISTGGAGRAALEAALASEFGIAYRIEPMLLSGRTDRAIVRDLFLFHGIEDHPTQREKLILGYLGHLPTHLARLSGRLLPGIGNLLQKLSQRSDVILGLLTGNTQRGAQIKLGHFGIADYFSCGGYGDLCLDRDDVARAAVAAVREHHPGHRSDDRLWVIGDTPLDIRCARGISACAVAVATGWHSREELAGHQPDLLFDDLDRAEHDFLPLLLTENGEQG